MSKWKPHVIPIGVRASNHEDQPWTLSKFTFRITKRFDRFDTKEQLQEGELLKFAFYDRLSIEADPVLDNGTV